MADCIRHPSLLSPRSLSNLDFRALWSLTVDVPTSYTYDFWARYSEFARQLAHRAGVDMRTLDRALWKYSEMRQRAA